MHDEQSQLLKQITMAFYLPNHLRGLAWNLQKRFDQTRYEWLIREVTSFETGKSC
jgi:hypothetical protein